MKTIRLPFLLLLAVFPFFADATEIKSASVAETINVTFNVDMRSEEISPNGVFVKGNWDDWTSGVKMEVTSKSIYSATIPVMKNFSLNYKFYNGDPDGNWFEMKGEDFHGECTDEWTNRIFNVEETDTVLEKVCFASCNRCQPINPAQMLSKGVGFPLVFDVSSPYDIQFNYYTIEDFRNIKKLGINTIRLAFTRATLFEENSTDPSPLFFYLLDQYVDMAEAEGINLVLAFGELFDYANDPTIQDKLIKVWTTMAEHYNDRSTRIFYELNNEPNGLSDEAWGQIQGNVIDAVREIDQTHTIIVTPIWGSLTNLDKLPVYEDDNLIYTFHFYDPFLFTHQGARLASLTEFVGVPFPYNEEKMPPMPASFVGGYYEWLYNKFETDATADAIRELINTAVKFKNERNVPLWCGEFGVVGPADHDEKVYWYSVLRSSLEENGIPWSLLGYTYYTGPFKEGTYRLFDHDFDIPVVEALGLIVPPQTDFVVEAETVGFDIYKDYPSPNIHTWVSSNEGTTHLLSEEDPYEGKFCIYTEDLPLWSGIEFQFEPYRDLSELVANGYILEFMVKGDTPGAKFNVRFMDTKTKDPEDLSWRIVHDVDETMAAWDGEWHLIQIPLSDFVEQGTWDGEWHNPEGKFDWKAIGSFQITTEFHGFEGMKFWFDNIRITEPKLPETSTVTFQVDMKKETVSSSGVHLAGSMYNNNPTLNSKLELTEGTIYSISIPLKKGESYDYKFVNGLPGEWSKYETITDEECIRGDAGDRFVEVPDEDLTLDAVCFSRCAACSGSAVKDSIAVTFMVDMQNETVSTSGVYLNGSMFGWDTSKAVKMSSTDGEKFAVALLLKIGETYSYKFVNGGPSEWSKYEIITDSECSTDWEGNRIVLVPEENIVLAPVCFKRCSLCSDIPLQDSVIVTFQVDMKKETVSSSGVHLAGSMYNNNPTLNSKLELAESTIYSISIPLKKGESYDYKFVNGLPREWSKYETITDAGCTRGDAGDRFVEVPDEDLTLDVVCFSRCAACSGSAVKDSIAVTFMVDMQNETVSSSGVYFNGSMFGWDTSKAVKMSSTDGEKFAVALLLKIGETYSYKFVNGGPSVWSKYEIITDSECSTDWEGNRIVEVPKENVVLAPVCFKHCSLCTDGSDKIETFKDKIEVYPNPVKNKITISGLSESNTIIKLFKIDGVLLGKFNFEGKKTIETDISLFQRGVYIVHVENGEQKRYFRLIKE